MGFDSIFKYFRIEKNPLENSLYPGITGAVIFFFLLAAAVSPVAAEEADGNFLAESPEIILGSHSPPFLSASWSPRGDLIASPGPDGDIVIWNSDTGHTVELLSDHDRIITDLSWDGSGEILASTSRDGSVLFRAIGEEEYQAYGGAHDDWVTSIDVHGDSGLAASGSWDRTVKIWDIETGKQVGELDSPGGWVREVKWSPGGDMIAAGTNDRAYVWELDEELKTGEVIHTLGGLRDKIRAAAWMDEGETLAIGDDDGYVKIYDLSGGESELRAENNINDRRLRSLEMRPQGNKLAAAGDFDKIKLLDPLTAEIVDDFEGHGDYVNKVDWSPTGDRLVSASEDDTVKQWDFEEKKDILTLTGHPDQINTVSWHPEGELLATAGNDNRPRIWHKDSPELQQMMIGHTAPIRDISWAPGGERLATASEDQAMIVWGQASQYEPLYVAGDHDRPLLDWSVFAPVTREKTTHEDWVFSVSWSSDENYLASASYDGTAGIWLAEDGDPQQILEHEEGWVRQAIWLPDKDEIITVGQKGGIHHWNIDGDLLERKELNDIELRGGSINTDGDRLAVSTYENQVKVFSLPGLEMIDVSKPRADLIFDIAWSPQDNYLAGAGGDKELIIWHLDDEEGLQKKSARPMPGYSSLSPRTVDWSPEMDYLATADGNHLLLWPIILTR